MPHRKKAPLSAECQAEAVAKFLDFLGQFGQPPTEVRDFLVPHLRIEVYSKKTVFWPRGLCSEYIYFVVNGIVRSTYLLPNGEEITNWLVGAGEVASIPTSLFTGSISQDDLQAVTEVLVIKIPYGQLSQNFERFPYLNKIRVAVMERYILGYEERSRALRIGTAQEQLDAFQSRYPELYNNVPLQMVASYLGMSKTTLLRLRQCTNSPAWGACEE
jgi:CRP-like cAMP-binding protein